MHITNIVIKNFRAIEDIHFDISQHVNVIVGPNAIGKTTILQAIRLLKAILAPRSQNESQQTLISLGASSPHFSQRIYFESLARDPKKIIEILCTYCFTENEIKIIQSEMPLITQSIIQSRLGQAFTNPTTVIQFLATPAGQEATNQTSKELASAIERLCTDKFVCLGMRIEPISGHISIVDPLAGIFISHLDQRLRPYATIFSYFPADRALPSGEVPVQLGSADTAQQLESHNSQPQLKYNRLKNMIFNTIIMGQEERQELINDFNKIFTEILKGRKIDSIGLNEIGMLSVVIEDVETGRKYEIDSLSSGEKGLALTFLLIAKTVSPGGIVILDEPELHLNPAVCKDVLQFMLETYALPLDIQFIVCTHSPEILSGAFSNDKCSLYHIISENIITRVGHKAIDEYSDALQKLGTSVSEALLYKGTIFVEGDDDVAFLETGFNHLLRRYKIKDRGGRQEVEKAAKKLQELEKNGEKVDPIFLIFDKDELVTDIKDSQAVKILQWQWRCIDNYFIDPEVITELLKRPEITKSAVTNEGEVVNKLRKLALSQINAVAAKEVYQSFNYQNPSLRGEDVKGNTLENMTEALYERLSSAKNSIGILNEQDWKEEFLRRCQQRKQELEPIWESSWKVLCDGKKLFRDFQMEGIIRVPIATFKRMIVQEMKNSKSDNWRLVESQLKDLLGLSSQG